MITLDSGSAFELPADLDEVTKDLAELFISSKREFSVIPDRAGLDFGLQALPGERKARARIKIFSPRPGTVAAWFYKDSQVHFSTDRFSYGALILRSKRATSEELQQSLAWIESGLHPEKRPKSIRRAFPFTIPI